MAATCLSSSTSQTCAVISPASRSRATVSSIASAFLSTAKTFAAPRANSAAAGRPFPQPGPLLPARVASATLPASRPGSLFFRLHAGVVDHLRPLLHLPVDEGPELLGRIADQDGTLLRHLGDH